MEAGKYLNNFRHFNVYYWQYLYIMLQIDFSCICYRIKMNNWVFFDLINKQC
jgi:hypothetical protein